MKTKNRIFNIIMIVFCVLLVFGGIFFVSNLKNAKSATKEDIFGTASEIIGSVKIQRKGIGYTLEPNSTVVTGDIITTFSKSRTKLSLGENSEISLAENTKLSAEQIDGQKKYVLHEGEIYIEHKGEAPVVLSTGKDEFKTADASFSLNLQGSAPNLYVLDGKVSATVVSNNSNFEIPKSEKLFVQSDGKPGTENFEIRALSSFVLQSAQNSNRENLKSQKTEFDNELSERAKYASEAIKQDLNKTDGKASGKVTISIDVKSILGKMDKLKPEKRGYVPNDGMILHPIEVDFKEGETAFDILKKVTESAGIQLEYTWNAVFGSNYIEGIAHLYEFDGGEGSGWMYQINGWYPDRGVSAYKLKDGDHIEFRYTCDFGKDLRDTKKGL